MKIPKKIQAFGYIWKVKIVKEISNDNAGGKFSFKDKTITVSNKYGEEEAIFLHELIEAIFLQLQYRFYGQEGNMEYTFHFNHTQYVVFIQNLYQILKDNKLI